MNSIKATARQAGMLYLLTAILAPFSLIYIPTTLFVPGDAAATAHNIVAHETLFRFGVVSGLVSEVIFIFVVLAFYRLLKGVHQNHALLMVVLVLVSVAIGFMNTLHELAALVLVRGADFLSAFDKPQRDALAMLFLRLSRQQTLVAEILWGLWLFPLAILVYRSRFLPRFLGVWLIINGFAYLAMSFTGLIFPHHEKLIGNIAFPALLGELALMLWLLIKGAKENVVDAPSMGSV
jgi:hypothetical protein